MRNYICKSGFLLIQFLDEVDERNVKTHKKGTEKQACL